MTRLSEIIEVAVRTWLRLQEHNAFRCPLCESSAEKVLIHSDWDFRCAKQCGWEHWVLTRRYRTAISESLSSDEMGYRQVGGELVSSSTEHGVEPAIDAVTAERIALFARGDYPAEWPDRQSTDRVPVPAWSADEWARCSDPAEIWRVMEQRDWASIPGFCPEAPPVVPPVEVIVPAGMDPARARRLEEEKAEKMAARERKRQRKAAEKEGRRQAKSGDDMPKSATVGNAGLNPLQQALIDAGLA